MMTTPQAPTIQILNHSVIDQIAAGEVVDRPAHMIKELCENSLDAQADEIFIDFKSGGREVLIRDNGLGISKSELKLALARHATSKINVADDLWSIATYGFRGEALASIAAVSQLKLISRTKNQKLASQVDSKFGKLSEVFDTGGDIGTTVEIQNLFENVPARLKFLKSDVGESSAIKLQIKALALANHSVTFRVLQNNELIFYWPKVASRFERVVQIFERENLYEGSAQVSDVSAQVILSSPNDTVKNSKNIWLFVRGRYVADRGLQAAVTEAYRNLLMHGEFPIAAVYVDCDPENLDVNVSPTKSQVKFRDANTAFRAVHHAVRGVLEKAPWLKDILGSAEINSQNPSGHEWNSNLLHSPQKMQSEEIQNESFKTQDFARVQFQVKNFAPVFSVAEVEKSLRSIEAPEEVSQVLNKVSGMALVTSTASSVTATWSNLALIGQAHRTYIVAQKEDGVVFIDQHAAHERVVFEKIMKSRAENTIEVQNFLLPHVIHLPEDQLIEVLKCREDLAKMGLHFDQLGPSELAIQAAPSLVKDEALKPLFEKLGQECTELGGSFQFERTVSHIVATLACHSAVRAGQTLSLKEMSELLKQMDEFPLSSFCPHGRPVFVEYPIRKLEKDFGRIV